MMDTFSGIFCSRTLVLIFCFVAEVFARDVCSTSIDGYIYYCDEGWYCCGRTTCCKVSSASLSGGVIAGIVIGCLVGGTFLIVFIRAACRACNKNRQQVGQVIYPQTTAPRAGVQFISSGQVATPQTSYGQPPPGQPPVYGKYP